MIGAGIAAALAAAVANAFAVVLQASEARRTPKREGMHASLLRRLVHRRRWMLGTALMVVAGVLQVVALAFAPISVVQPMLSTSQLVLLAVARVSLRERIGRHEVLAALTIVLGLAAAVSGSPRYSIVASSHTRLALPLAVVGGCAALAYLFDKRAKKASLSLVIGAGLTYAWTDFVVKLFTDRLTASHWLAAIPWAAGAIGAGAVAFLEENTALQRRPAVTVAPVIGALKVPIPVLMALWAGVQPWKSSPLHIALLLGGLALVAAGAAALGRSETVAKVSAGGSRDERR